MTRWSVLLCLSWALVGAAGPSFAQTRPPAMQIAVVLRIDGPPVLQPNGQPVPESRAIDSLEAELQSLEHADVPFALSISPVLADELLIAERTDVYASLLALASGHPVMSVPYAHALLPDLSGAGAVASELRRGSVALERTMRTSPSSVVDPPGLSLDDASLHGIAATGAVAALASSETVGASPLRSGGVTLIPALPLPTGAHPGAALRGRYASTARLALVAPVRPGVAGALRALRADGRIAIVPPRDLAAGAAIQRIAFEPPGKAPASYSGAIARADDAARGFASYTLPQNPTAKLLAVLLARARSTADWLRDWKAGITRARVVVELAGAERYLVSAPDGAVTLTSRRGTVPVSVDNRAAYPVRVRVRVTSPKLTFPTGDARLVTIPPRGDTLTFVAEARSTGTFPMTVLLQSPDGRVDFPSGTITVRSTAANVLALFLTLSGALFLVVWSSRDVIRRRVARRRL